MADGGGLGDFLALFSADIISLCCFLQSLPREFKCWLVNVLSMIFLYCSASVPSIRCSATSNTARFLLFCLEQTYVWKIQNNGTWNLLIVYVIVENQILWNSNLILPYLFMFGNAIGGKCPAANFTLKINKKIKANHIKQGKVLCLNMIMIDIYLN